MTIGLCIYTYPYPVQYLHKYAFINLMSYLKEPSTMFNTKKQYLIILVI